MVKASSRNGKIDLLKFLFSILIVLNHSKYILPKDIKGTVSGFSLSVEFFFLVSGCLLMASVERAEKSQSLSLGKETGLFMIRKFRSLYPEVLVAYVMRVVIVCTFTATELFPLIEKSWFDALLLNSTGLRGKAVMSVTWYVSSMLLCMAFLYPFIRKYKKMAINVILPVGVLLLLGFMYRNYGTVRGPMSWNGFTYRGNLRALAELSLGCLCYCLSKRLKNVDFNAFGKALLALIELSCYGVYVYYMYSGVEGVRDFFYIFILCIGVIISFSGKSFGHSQFNNRFFSFLGKFSLPLYLIHSSMSKRMFDILPAAEAMEWQDRLLIYLALSFAGALAVMLISKLIRRVGPFILSGVKRLTVKPAPVEEKS